MVIGKRYIFYRPNLLFLWGLLFLFGCGKPQFSLDFSLTEDVRENYDVTYYAADHKGGLTVQAVASVRDGKCELTGATKEPTLVSISTHGASVPLIVYARKGDKILISGEGRNPLGWKTEGNEINEKLTAWRLANLATLESNEPDSINRAVKDYAELNNSDPVATIIILSYYDRGADPGGYASLMASLRGPAREDVWLRVAARADQQFHGYAFPAKFQSLLMRSLGEWADTLKADGRNRVMLLFWQTGYAEKKDMVDSIKTLKEVYPDSVRIIADLCLDVDSATWRSAIRRDSLDFIKRFWVPEGLADPTIRKFQVAGLPYFIVFDSLGNQIYRGDNLGRAMKAYRAAPDSLSKEN